MHESDLPLELQIITRLATAASVRELARELSALVETGPLDAVVVWNAAVPGGPLRGVHRCGVDEERLAGFNPNGDLELLSSAENALPWTRRCFRGAEGVHGVVIWASSTPEEPAWVGRVMAVFGDALLLRARADADSVRARHFDDLSALVADGVIVATPDGAVPVYNPALASMTGWTLEDVRTHGWTHLVYPDPSVRAEAQKAIAALTLGSASEGIVRDLSRKDGTSFEARIWSRIQAEPSGFAPSMLGVLRDASAERTAHRRAIWEESQSQLEKLAGGIAHEFNNLLAAIMGHADLIAMTDTSERVRGHAETILQSAERGTEMSSQILAFSGAAQVRARPLEVGSLLHQVLELFRPQLPDDVGLDVRIEEGLPALEVDPGLVQQMVINLLSNAVDAMPDGGRLTLQADRGRPPADVRYRSPSLDGQVEMGRIRVADTGPGFSEEALQNLFVPFYTGKRNGHGVGLPAVRGIIGAHGGAIDAHNDDGGVVEVYLPVSRRPELSLPDLIEDSDGGGARVWVVDDQSAVLEFSRISLEALGYAVSGFDGVRSMADRLERAPRQGPDLVVLDIVMPDGGGRAAYEALLQAGFEVPILWTSGHASDGVELPATGTFLQKPYTGRALARVIAGLLRP